MDALRDFLVLPFHLTFRHFVYLKFLSLGVLAATIVFVFDARRRHVPATLTTIGGIDFFSGLITCVFAAYYLIGIIQVLTDEESGGVSALVYDFWFYAAVPLLLLITISGFLCMIYAKGLTRDETSAWKKAFWVSMFLFLLSINISLTTEIGYAIVFRGIAMLNLIVLLTSRKTNIGWLFLLQWVLASTVGFIVGEQIGYAADYLVCTSLALLTSIPIFHIVGALGNAVCATTFGTVVGASVGILQWLVVQRHVSKADWWVLINMVGWIMGGVVGYAAGIVLLVQRDFWKKCLAPLQAVGRLALTNYLLQTLICTTLFYSYGLGLYGKVGPVDAALLAIAIYLLQVALSSLWVRRFRFGPAEWLWRSITYGQLQPMRIT